MAGSITAEKIVIAISSQIDPAKLATLKSNDACNNRLNRCAYWMHQASIHGLDVGGLIGQATSRYSDTDRHRALTMRALLRNHKRTEALGCCTSENLLRLRSGYSATITVGRHAGQKLEVDHIVPKSLVPALAKDFANLSYQPYSINRTKSDRVGHAQLRAVKIFARNDLVPATTVDRVQALVSRELSVRAARSVLPGTTAYLASVPSFSNFGAGAADPRIIIAQVDQLIERIHDWEPRADSALSSAEVVQRQTAEHTTRTQALLCQAESRAQEDATAARRLEAELADWHSRGESDMLRAEQCVKHANAASNHASQTSQRWKREVNFAKAWQRRSEFRESKARDKVNKAQESLNRAENALSNAEAALERARHRTRPVGRDSQGRTIYEPIDTTPYETRVRERQDRVERCEAWLNRAQEELKQATNALQAAEARVDACTQAVKVANDAETAAATSRKAAEIAMAAVERASEEHVRVNCVTDQARKAADRAQAAVVAMAKHTAAAAACASDAVTSLQTAQNHHASSRRRSTLGCMEMSCRMEQLRAFDGPVNEF